MITKCVHICHNCFALSMLTTSLINLVYFTGKHLLVVNKCFQCSCTFMYAQFMMKYTKQILTESHTSQMVNGPMLQIWQCLLYLDTLSTLWSQPLLILTISVQFKRFFIFNPHIKKTYNRQTFQSHCYNALRAVFGGTKAQHAGSFVSIFI